jgi:hypothetical protein
MFEAEETLQSQHVIEELTDHKRIQKDVISRFLDLYYPNWNVSCAHKPNIRAEVKNA